MDDDQKDIDRHVDVKEAGRLLGIKRSKIYDLMSKKELAYILPPTMKKRLIPLSSIKAFLARAQASGVVIDG